MGAVLVIRSGAPPLGGNNLLAVRQKLFADPFGLFEQPARIVAQIHDERLHSPFGQLRQGGVQIVGRFLAELVDPHVTDAVLAQRKLLLVVDVLHRRHLDDGPHQVKFLGFAGRRTMDGDGNLGAGRPAQHADGVFQSQLLRALVVDLDNLVPGQHAGAIARRVVHGRNDRQ